jgi:hypothetical protein
VQCCEQSFRSGKEGYKARTQPHSLVVTPVHHLPSTKPLAAAAPFMASDSRIPRCTKPTIVLVGRHLALG